MPSSDTPSPRNRLFLALRLLATALLIAIVLRAVPLGDTWQSLRTLALAAVIWALVAELAQRVLSIVRWHLLLAPAGARVPLAETLRLGFIALFYNNFMPSTVGGDVAKSYLAARCSQCSPAAIVASVLVDRAVVGWGSLVISGLIISAFLETPRYQLAILALLGGGLVAAAVVVLLARRKTQTDETVGGGLVARVTRKVADKLTEVSAALLQYRHHSGSLASSFFVSCVTIVIMGVALHYWCLGLGYHVPVPRLIAVAVILKIVGIVPVTIGNIGWTEGAMVVLLVWAGVSKGDALAVGVAQRMAGIGFSLIGAGLQFWQPKKGSAEASPLAVGEEQTLDRGASV